MTSSIAHIGLNVLCTIGLVCLSGLFSGLTLGLMTLDIVDLEILARSGLPDKKKYAKAVLPVRQNGNRLLCSLLIGNTITNAFLAIFLANLTSGVVGLVISTGLIVLFGEIIPQAICSKHGLLVGAELKTLIALHVEDQNAALTSGLTHEDTHLMTAVLDYKDRLVKEVMTPLERVYMLESSTELTYDKLIDIHRSGYTRIPVYDGYKRTNIKGILYTKDLMLISSGDKVKVQTVLAFHGKNHHKVVFEDDTLAETLRTFKQSRTHLMIVKSPKTENNSVVTGIITFEDVIEEVLDAEIIDETDRYIDNTQRETVEPTSGDPNFTEFLSMFDRRLTEEKRLSEQEIIAISHYLRAAYPSEFAQFADQDLFELLQKSKIIKITESGNDQQYTTGVLEYSVSAWMHKTQPNSRQLNSPQVLYRQGEQSTVFTLVLEGHVDIRAGNEKLPSQIGPWNILGKMALTKLNYVPDFDAEATVGCRVVQIASSDYSQFVRKNSWV